MRRITLIFYGSRTSCIFLHNQRLFIQTVMIRSRRIVKKCTQFSNSLALKTLRKQLAVTKRKSYNVLPKMIVWRNFSSPCRKGNETQHERSKDQRKIETSQYNSTFPSLAVGLASGTLGSLVGMGGGFVAVPMMTSMLKMSQVFGILARVIKLFASAGIVVFVG